MYQLLSTLQGARDAVISLSFSTPTKFVAAAGYGGVTVWNLSTSSAVSIPSNVYNPRNPGYIYTACNFLHFEQADQYILLLGSQDGMFSTLKWDGEDHVFNPGFQIKPDDSRYQVVSLDVYQTEVPTGKLARVVVATADSRIAVYSLSSSLEVKKIYAIFIEEFSPLAARFCTRTRDVYVFEQTGGGILQLDDKSGEIKSHQSFGPDPMGTICMDESSKYFVACTGKAFEMFRLDTIEYVRRFDSGPPVVLFPKVSTFAENGNILVGGTDSGRAIVFDVSSGAQIQQLDYPKGGLVQPVAACTIEDGFLVAIAGSTLEHPADVLIFKQALISPSTASKDTPATVNFFHHLRRKGSLGHYFLLTLCILLAINGLHSFVLTCTPLVQFLLKEPMSMMRPVESMGSPLESIDRSLDSTARPLDSTARPLDSTARPLDSAARLLDSAARPLDSTSQTFDNQNMLKYDVPVQVRYDTGFESVHSIGTVTEYSRVSSSPETQPVSGGDMYV